MIAGHVAAQRFFAVQVVQRGNHDEAAARRRTRLHAISGNDSRFREPAYRRVGPAHQTVAKRFQFARDLRAQRAKEQGVDEPPAVRVVAAKGILRLDDLLEALDRVGLPWSTIRSQGRTRFASGTVSRA